MSLKIFNFIIIFVLAMLALGIFANGMAKPLSHDEQMYTAAGVLTTQGKMIYRDFSYPGHLPYHPLILAALFKLFNTSYYLFTARTLSCLCDIITMICIVFIYLKILKPCPVMARILALAAAVLYVFHPAVEYASGYGWNNNITIACVVIATALFVCSDKPGLLSIAIIAVLLTFATGIRITTALAELCFFIAILLMPCGSLKQKIKSILVFLLTTAAVLIYPVYIIAQAPQAFWLNLIRIPVLNGQWQYQMSLNSSVITPDIAKGPWITADFAYFIAMAVVIFIALFCNRQRLKVTNAVQPLLVAMLIIVFFIIALVPPTTWKQYLAMPVPFIIISFAFPVLYLNLKEVTPRPARSLGAVVAVFLLCAFVFAAINFGPLQKISLLFRPQMWTAIKLHNIAKDIAQSTPEPKKVLTLGPLYALEGGCDIYDQLSAGPFVYRIAEALSAEEIAITKSISPDQLKQLVPSLEPCAVVVGVEPAALERALLEVVRPDWQKKVYDDGITVYFKP